MAKPRGGTVKKEQAREIDGSASVLVVQFSEPEPVPSGDIETFVTEILSKALSLTRSRPAGNKAWTFFLATEREHATDLHCWIGVGAGVHPKVVDAVQNQLDARRCRTSREHAVIAHHALRPLLAVTADSVEVPLGAESPDEATAGRIVEQVVRKPFVVDLQDLFKKDLMAAMMLGDERPFLFRYFHDDALATLRFGRIDLQMFLRHGDGSYTAVGRISTTPACVLTFDFLEPQLSELIATLPETIREQLVSALMQARPFRIAPGSVVVGIHGRPSPPDGSDSTTFVVERFLPAARAALTAHF